MFDSMFKAFDAGGFGMYPIAISLIFAILFLWQIPHFWLLLLVLVFDRIIPPGREPGFPKGSQWRPVLSSWGQYGLRSLPPDVEDYIDRLKRQHRI